MWAIRIQPGDLPRLAPLRLRSDVRLWPADAEEPRSYWLRGDDPAEGESAEAMLRRFPALARYRVAPDGLATPFGCVVPECSVPDLRSPQWANFGDWWQPRVQPAALSAEPPPAVAIRLVPAQAERPAGAVLLGASAWARFAAGCPAHRLDRLRFAADCTGRALVVGMPLPAVRGDYFVVEDRVALPAGWQLEPAIPCALLAERLGLRRGDIALISPDGTCERIAAEQFVVASRSAARLTAWHGETPTFDPDGGPEAE